MQRDLILLRHAEAAKGLANDFDRVLTEKGQEQAERIGRRLARAGLRPDLVVSSPAPRALSTAVLACRELGIPERSIVEDHAVYDAEVVQLLAVLERHGGAASRLMLVGHNPSLSDLGAYLAKPAMEGMDMRKGQAVHLELDAPWGQVNRAKGKVAAVLDP